MVGKFETIFVTGGAGYIGSHCVVTLLEAGYNVIACDNFSNSVMEDDGTAASLKRVEKITRKSVTFYYCDLLDIERLREIFSSHKIDCVIHFAAMKSVSESMEIPISYYRSNLIGAINLIEVMKIYQCYQLVFSSSCCVYGNPERLPITEDSEIGNVTNVYGRTKYMTEEVLMDISRVDKRWNIVSLRYFNPVGAHPSGLIGEDPTKPCSNLMPLVAKVALGNIPAVDVFGNDYFTHDGTGVRDYIHVMDLAAGHVAALEKIEKNHISYRAFNLGTGEGVSVLQLLQTFSQVTGMNVPYEIKDRREGDVGSMYSNGNRAQQELGWLPKYTLEDMCKDCWRWYTMNPNGYHTKGGMQCEMRED